MLARTTRRWGSVTDRGTRLSVEKVEQQAHGVFANLLHRLRDGRQRRVRVRGIPHVVEPDDRQVLGHAQGVAARGAERADGHFVVETENRGRRMGSREQQISRDRPGLDGEVAVRDEQVVFGLDRFGRAGHAEETVPAERADERSRHDADPAMAERVQMIHRLGGGCGIVDVHARDSELWTELAGVDDRRTSRGG